jgi:DeoR family fructose operon transcriptional repressor
MTTRRADGGGTATLGPEQRFERMLGWLDAEGRLDVGDTAVRLSVAQETIRRDLRVLESRGLLLRVHGGAVQIDRELSGTPALPVAASAPAVVASEDRELLDALWGELPRTGTLLLGPGRLTLELAQVIVNDPPEDELTVVTSSLDVALLLSRVSQVSVYNIGGTVSPSTHAQEGDWALTELHRLHTDVSVVCPAGVTTSGLSQPSPAAAAVSQAEVAAASRVVALAEGAALGRPSFVTFAELDEVERVVVAGDPAPWLVSELSEHGIPCTDRRSVAVTRRGRRS